MRILKLGVYYPAYLRQFYAARPALLAAGYADQHAALLKDGFGSSFFWTSALGALGHTTTDLVINAEPMQHAWSREHGVEWNAQKWMFDIARAQVKAFRPDALFVADYSTVTRTFLTELKEECPSIRATLIWCGAPYRSDEVFRAADVVLSCIPEHVERFRTLGFQSEHVNHAFEPAILDALSPSLHPTIGFSFLGSVMLENFFHGERERILAALVDATELQLRANLVLPSHRQWLAEQARVAAFDTVRRLRHIGVPDSLLAAMPMVRRVAAWRERPSRTLRVSPKIVSRSGPPLFGLEMFQYLRDSRVTLNTHIEVSPRSASNMRMFEATGVGTCLLTDRKDNLAKLFEPDREVVSFASIEECIEKAHYLLAHEKERAEIAAAGQRRTLRDHTFSQRASQVDAILHDVLAGRRPIRPMRVNAPAPQPGALGVHAPHTSAQRLPGRTISGSLGRWIRRVRAGFVRESATFEVVEARERQFYLDTIRPGMTVFDAGAHTGGMTLLFSRAAAGGMVHAFEPESLSFGLLKARCGESALDNVRLNHVALADRAGTVALHVYGEGYRSWTSQADRPLAAYGIDVKPVSMEHVPAVTLDGYCLSNAVEVIDLLKIDVEGAELQVLMGAETMLSKQRIRCVTFEFGQTTFDMGNSPDQIESLFARHRYEIRNIVAEDPPFPGRQSAQTARYSMHVARPR